MLSNREYRVLLQNKYFEKCAETSERSVVMKLMIIIQSLVESKTKWHTIYILENVKW